MKQIQSNTDKKVVAVTMIGIIVMILMTATKVVPSTNIAGYSVFVGIACFFIVEAIAKTKDADSGLRFASIPTDLKKPGVLLWLLLPAASSIITLILGNLIFRGAFSTHIMGRAGALLAFDKILLLIGQVVIAAFGEEIAFRGFFFGKGTKLFPVWIGSLVSSAVFAAGHIAIGNPLLVAYDIATVFLDSLLYTVVYHKSGNCVISTFSHILANALSIVAVFTFL